MFELYFYIFTHDNHNDIHNHIKTLATNKRLNKISQDNLKITQWIPTN